MARTRTRAQLRDEARSVADQVNSQFVTDAEANRWIDQGIAKVWNNLVRVDPLRYVNPTPYSLSTTAGTTLYNLETLAPTLLEVVHVAEVDGDRRYRLQRIPFQERETWVNGGGVGYCLYGNSVDGTGQRIELLPDPGTKTYEIHYVQRPQLLATDAAVFDGIFGSEEYVVDFVAQRMAEKEENWDLADRIERRMTKCSQEITEMGAYRDTGQPRRVQDTAGRLNDRRRMFGVYY